MKYLLPSIAIILFSLVISSCNNTQPSNETEDKKIEKEEKKHMLVAYVAGYRDYDFSKIDVSNITHINYAFANIDSGLVVFDTSKIDGKNLTSRDIVALNSLKSKKPELQVLVSVGGWSWSGGFSDAALTDESRLKFAKSCAKFVETYQLDGIDLDWEYPNQVGAGNTHRPEDVKNFTLLLKSVREQLDILSTKEGNKNHYLLAIATGADLAYAENTELSEIHKYLDFLNIMTYDFYNGHHKTTGHHSNLMASGQRDLDMNSVVNAVDLHINSGFPAEKINLGIPFYGRIWEGVEQKNNEILFQNAETVGMGIDYIDFYQDINSNGFERFWDSSAKAPYLWNKEKKIFISYEDEESIKYKIEYLKEKGLAGVMFWEYCADKDKQLLNAITNNLYNQ